MKTNHFTTILLALIITLLPGCHSSKRGVITETSNADASTLFKELTQDYKGWSDVYMPVNVSLKSPMQLSVSGRATLIRDKEVMLSLRMLGFEVAVVYINQQDIYLIDKYHKMYFSESIDKLPADLPVTLGNIQDMLLGRVFAIGETTLTPADSKLFDMRATNDRLILTPAKGSHWDFTLSRTTPPLLSSLTINLKPGQNLTCDYSDQTETPAGRVASLMTLNTLIGDKDATLSIEWDLSGAKWDSGRTVTFNKPNSSYKRITIEALMKSLNNM